MADERVRALERRWQASGALEDGAAWLSARLQAGDLSPRHLEVAYLCGHPAARALGPARPLLSAKLAGFVFQVTGSTLNAWGKKGCPRIQRGRTFVFDLAAVAAWRTTVPPHALSGSRGRHETFVGNLVRTCGFHDPFAAYQGTLAALRAALGAAPHELAERVLDAAGRWLADPGASSEVATALAAYPPAQAMSGPPASAGFLIEAIDRYGDDFAAARDDSLHVPIYWTDGHGHAQLDRMGRITDGLVYMGSAGEDPRAYDRRLLAAAAPALAAWALGRPARSSPRPVDS